MNIEGIKYISPTFDSSGYGQASRGYVLALHKKGIPITLDPVSFEGWNTDLGENGELLESLIDTGIDYNIVIVHLTPEFWKSKVELDKVNLGYTVWETDRLHPKWVDYINNTVQGVMVGCDWNIGVFKNSGIKIPVFTVPHGIDFDEFENVDPYTLIGVDDNAFKFYDVFQFTERKHPVALIKSYWHAFQNNENVALILKTYKNDFTSEEKTKVKDIVKKLKNVTPMESYPPVYLILDQLSRQEVLGVHKTGDCFVSLDRGEGFGLCGFEAGAFGNPIIVTGIGGALEYAKPDHSYLVDYTMTPVSGMPWSPWYMGEMLWAEPDCGHAISLMRRVYENQNEARAKGKLLRKYIANNFSWDKVADRMLEVIHGM